MAHTPGKWRFELRNVSKKDEPCLVGYIEADTREVAVLYGDEDRDANGSLIAAAPDLLSALKALFADYKRLADSGDAGNWSLEEEEVGKQALAAIEKAEGR